MKITYGLDIQESDDPYILVAVNDNSAEEWQRCAIHGSSPH